MWFATSWDKCKVAGNNCIAHFVVRKPYHPFPPSFIPALLFSSFSLWHFVQSFPCSSIFSTPLLPFSLVSLDLITISISHWYLLLTYTIVLLPMSRTQVKTLWHLLLAMSWLISAIGRNPQLRVQSPRGPQAVLLSSVLTLCCCLFPISLRGWHHQVEDGGNCKVYFYLQDLCLPGWEKMCFFLP